MRLTGNFMTEAKGIVYFIGAGPGDPELLTLKGKRLLEEAGLVLYAGSLVNPAVLAHAHPDAARHSSAGMDLEEQIKLMRAAVERGQTVARLHTGDPAIYGATFEQMRRLEAEGLDYRVVPGVTSALAAAAALGIELTVPERTQTVIFSRLCGRTNVPEREALARLAEHRASLLLFLSAGMIERVVDELLATGYRPDTPIAVAFRVSWPDERIIRGTLTDIAEQVRAAEITHHALIVVSPALQAEVTAGAPDSHLYGTAQAAPERAPTMAIVSLTRGGTATGQRLLAALEDAVLYAPARFLDEANGTGRVRGYETSVRQVLQSAFRAHTALVAIMASGIVVRDLAPLLRSKHADPGVVVLDEAGRHAVSLLSGHQGGANRLARRIADCLGGTAVITTASDVQDLPALDLLGEAEGWRLERAEAMTAVSAALVNGDSVGVVQEAGGEQWWAEPLPPNLMRYSSLRTLQEARPAAAILITPHHVPPALLAAVPATVIYRPACLVVGVGCKRDTPAEQVLGAIRMTLAEAGLAEGSVELLVSVEDKAEEAGLLAAARALARPVRFYNREALAAAGPLPNPSPYVQKVLGIPGVAEPAAMLAAGAKKLLVQKRKFANVTVAVAQKEDA